MDRRPWDTTLLPYLALAVTPALTLPVSAALLLSLPDCGEDEPWWRLGQFEVALLPALADLLPFLWLLSGRAAVKRAALLAGSLGAARYAVPQAATLVYGVSSGGQASDPGCSISSFFAVGVLAPAMLILWLISVLAVAVITGLNRRTRPPG